MATTETEQDERAEEQTSEVPEAPEAARTNLGPCHYDMGELATYMASRDDGSGWIAVCEDHRNDAENDGYSVSDEPYDVHEGEDPSSPDEDKKDSGEDD